MDETRKKYFEAVVIAERGWGPIEKEIADKDNGFFFCGKCTTSDHSVYHNLIGQHLHISQADLVKRIEAAPLN